MARGLDADVDCAAQAKCIKDAGFDFVAHYYKFTSGSQPLTHAQAVALSQAGLDVVAVYERGLPRRASYFSHTKDVQDGTRAYEYARDTIGQSAGSPIYFAVDYDASAGHLQGVITEYFGMKLGERGNEVL